MTSWNIHCLTIHTYPQWEFKVVAKRREACTEATRQTHYIFEARSAIDTPRVGKGAGNVTITETREARTITTTRLATRLLLRKVILILISTVLHEVLANAARVASTAHRPKITFPHQPKMLV